MQKLKERVLKIWNYTISAIQKIIKKDEKIIILGSWFGERYSDNSRYLYEYLNSNKKRYNLKKVIWITQNINIFQELKSQNKEVYMKKSIKSIFYHLKAKYHIIDQSTNDIFGKLSSSSETIKINLWHGIPLKKIGKYVSSYKKQIVSGGNWNKQKVLVCSRFGESLIGDAFEVDRKDCFYGMYPRNNFLVSGEVSLLKEEENFMKILDKKIKKNKKIIFYLPTFRDNKQILFLGESNEKKIEEFFDFLEKNNYFLVTKLHFAGTDIMKRAKDSVNLDGKKINYLNIPSNIDVYPFLKKADILITDYSSVYFDFLYLNRDIIFYPYDLNYYENEDRGLLLDYEENTPGNKVYNLDELIGNLKDRLNTRDEYGSRRLELLKRCFGESTIENTVKNILNLKN
ncbi:MAG: CDP-glycerol glycerophosphotransferase family protein [Fusobacteriaceae bacterium]